MREMAKQSIIEIRDRIRELRRVPASDLISHVKNWRRHPHRQKKAMRAVLQEIGYADALLARLQILRKCQLRHLPAQHKRLSGNGGQACRLESERPLLLLVPRVSPHNTRF